MIEAQGSRAASHTSRLIFQILFCGRDDSERRYKRYEKGGACTRFQPGEYYEPADSDRSLGETSLALIVAQVEVISVQAASIIQVRTPPVAAASTHQGVRPIKAKK
jgi:hypothetical protein